ncbi:MAG: COX15/CtaA family protein [Thiogranum sp.]|nr:COX15/CtaA family protein [Thiogranum sp.]
MTNANKKGGLFSSLVFLALLLTFAAVVLSAYLRLENIGLGCADWPTCFGYLAQAHPTGLVPASAAGAVHRFTASLLGVVVLVITLMALRGRRPAGVGVLAPLLVFALTVFLSVLGYSTPSPDLPAVTLGNLGGGMAMLALLWWIGQRAVETVEPVTPRGLRLWTVPALVLLIVQIGLGAWTSATLAGPSCPALPGCGDGWQSMENLRQGFDLTARLAIDESGRVITDTVQQSLHMVHRFGALATFVFLVAAAVRAVNADPRFRATAITIVILLLIQVGVGTSAVLGDLPLLLVTAHNALAALLLLAVVNLNHLATPGRRADQGNVSPRTAV